MKVSDFTSEKELVEQDSDNIFEINEDWVITGKEAGMYVITDNEEPIIISVPTAPCCERGQEITIFRNNGEVKIDPYEGVTVKGIGKNIAYRYGAVTLKNIKDNEWHLIGALN